jgi:hypothetical protein
MIEKAIHKIAMMAIEAMDIKQVDIHGKTYFNQNLHRIDPPEMSEPETLGFNTLEGLVDFIREENPSGARLHIFEPSLVSVIGTPDPANYNRRFEFARAEFSTDQFRFGHWYEKEEFIIALQSLFVQDESIEGLLSGVSSIISSIVKEDTEDNFSQHVQVKVGISLKEGVKIPNPIELRPYRTFIEVEQPLSRFAFRLRNTNDRLQLSLHQADGDAWKLEAITNLAAWFKDKVSVPVYA